MAAMAQFLAQSQQRAYKTALLSTRNHADALDLVQDAMLKLVQRYSGAAAEEWPLLFNRILHHRLIDWHRRQQRVVALFGWFDRSIDDADAEAEATAILASPAMNDPAQLVDLARDVDRVEALVSALPLRQQQVFLLRALEQFDVKETAAVLGCSDGSVKTHYARAMNRIRQALADEESAMIKKAIT